MDPRLFPLIFRWCVASGAFRHVTLSVGTGQNQNTLIPANFRIHFGHERPNVVGNIESILSVMSFHKDIICVACVRSIQSVPCNHKICLTSETCCSFKFFVCSTKNDPTEFYRLWLMTHEKFLVVPYVYDCSCTRTVVAAVLTCLTHSVPVHA
jgi:hypothetical protein